MSWIVVDLDDNRSIEIPITDSPQPLLDILKKAQKELKHLKELNEQLKNKTKDETSNINS